MVSVTIRVRNNGPLPAVDALAREIPQVDPDRPNQVARILGVKAGHPGRAAARARGR